MNPEREEPKGPATLDEANLRLQHRDEQIEALTEAYSAASLVVQDLLKDIERLMPTSLAMNVKIATVEELINSKVSAIREGRL